MFRKLKIDFKKCMACLLATLQIQAMSGCMGTSKNTDKKEPENITESLQIENQKLKDIINQKNANIVDLQKENEDLKGQISSLQDSNKKLEETINKGNNEPELNQDRTEEYVQKAFESASARSEQIRNSADPSLMIYKTYAYVSDEYKNLDGKRYVWVKVNSNDKYQGLFNLETLNEDIPCNTFDEIKDEFQTYTTGTYRWLSVPGDSDYKCGLYDTANSNLIIPCKAYKDIKYYEENGIYQCTKPDGTVDTIQLPFKENKYKIEDLFTYDRALDSQAKDKQFYGKSFFITAKVANDLDSNVYGGVNHAHCVGGVFLYNYNKPFYVTKDFFDGIGEDVILFLSDDNKPESVLCLDALYQDNYAYNTTFQQYANSIGKLIHAVDPISSMGLKEYLERNGMQDLIKDEYNTSELLAIMNFVEQMRANSR